MYKSQKGVVGQLDFTDQLQMDGLDNPQALQAILVNQGDQSSTENNQDYDNFNR